MFKCAHCTTIIYILQYVHVHTILIICHFIKSGFLPAGCVYHWFQHQHLTLSLGYFVQGDEAVFRGPVQTPPHWRSDRRGDGPPLHHTAWPAQQREAQGERHHSRPAPHVWCERIRYLRKSQYWMKHTISRLERQTWNAAHCSTLTMWWFNGLAQ